ncbi:rhodanese-like domain-containing protein [Achromobacter insolitus]|uniref:Thiosulfate sulfurtransferase GlpE n=1 Tax=Achromobacter insolitus TaxID=217204 RepID=A0A6S7EVI8_9BURK|nr:Thiosulfate sulfurtransferase GlpE [Achromobacter insolitus]CAB3944863.1 Thiosulfate sulfurtransferase GlpE [Achromobacter insolitus]
MATNTTHGDASAAPQDITAQALAAALGDGGGLALLDVRDHGVYARGHLFLASSAPYWRLELDIDRLVPRRSARVVLVDGGEGLATDAARKLQRLGYDNVSVLHDGIHGWEQAGFPLFTGTNVPGKAFGEVLEHELGTPHIDADELKRKLDAGDRIVVVDSRTPEEFADFSLPGAHSLPGAELVYRIGEVAPDPNTLIVVNCAGRTRSIVGAQTLINAGVPNRVVSLKDGTMAWLMNGDTLRHGHVAPAPEPSGDSLATARQRAHAMAQRAGVNALDAGELAELFADTTQTVYRFDVRDREEYQAGHLPGWRWAPGGQLVQATDEYAATRGAHLVLADWDGVRALTTAAWLAQLGGFTVHVHPVAQAPVLETGAERVTVLNAYDHATRWVAPTQLQHWLEQGGVAVLNIDNSVAHAQRHVRGAQFVAPSALIAHVQRQRALDPAVHVVLVSEDGQLARSAAHELIERGLDGVSPLLGGTQAWIRAGLPTDAGRASILTQDDDTWYGPYVFLDLEERNRKFNTYLDWELGLVAQLAGEPRVDINLNGSIAAR